MNPSACFQRGRPHISGGLDQRGFISFPYTDTDALRQLSNADHTLIGATRSVPFTYIFGLEPGNPKWI
jgi:hypothetical protein